MVVIGFYECNFIWRNYLFIIWYRLFIFVSDSFICKVSMGVMQGIFEMVEVYVRYYIFFEIGNDLFKQVVVIFFLVDVFFSISIIFRYYQMF